MRIAPEIIAGLCEVRARDLLAMREGALAQVNPVRLLWAFSGVESSFGLNSHPRHEQGYCFSGRYYDPKLTAEMGCLAHCSYGPWQVMYTNFPPGVSIFNLIPQADGHVAADLSCMAAISLLNRAIASGARTLDELVIRYNGPANVEAYMRNLYSALGRPMPAYTDRVVV